MTKDVANVMQYDNHGSYRQKVAEEKTEEKEHGHRVVQEHLLVVAPPLDISQATDQSLEPETELEQSIEEHCLVDLKEGHVNETICEFTVTAKEPRHPILVLANQEAPDRADSVAGALEQVIFNFLRDLQSFLLAESLMLAVLRRNDVHDEGARVQVDFSQYHDDSHGKRTDP